MRAAGLGQTPRMGRAAGNQRPRRTSDSVARRRARERVATHYGEALAALTPADDYRLGGLAAKLLAGLGLATDTSRNSARRQQLLPERAAEIEERGLAATLVADGVRPVPSVRQRLLEAAALDVFDEGAAEAAFERATARHRAEAATSRFAEFDWLVRHLCVRDRRGRELAEEMRARLLLNLWSAGGRPEDLPGALDHLGEP